MPHESVSAPTAAESTALRELKAFLNHLFQFESQELDFGIYKILHHKRAEIRRFIDELLTERVREQLLTLSNQQTAQAQRELDVLAQSPTISRWLAALAQHDATRIAIYEEDYKTDIRRYRELETLVRQARSANDAELRIYNHLTLFSAGTTTGATLSASGASAKTKNTWCPTTARKPTFTGPTTISTTSNRRCISSISPSGCPTPGVRSRSISNSLRCRPNRAT